MLLSTATNYIIMSRISEHITLMRCVVSSILCDVPIIDSLTIQIDSKR